MDGSGSCGASEFASIQWPLEVRWARFCVTWTSKPSNWSVDEPTPTYREVWMQSVGHLLETKGTTAKVIYDHYTEDFPGSLSCQRFSKLFSKVKQARATDLTPIAQAQDV